MSYSTSARTLGTDEDLWRKSAGGDRDAFGKIVEKYQTLVCSLAYSRCGSLARSEDLAQETFLIAWQRLGELREPSHLRAWLCGIARNLAAGAARRELRRGPTLAHEEDNHASTAPEADPAAQAISQEEADMLWRTLASLPHAYREPMILFYRQSQSVSEVAGLLGISEEAVKQRLSRGRVLLRRELAGLVEGALKRTAPGAAFKAAVMIALPLASASTTSAAAVAAMISGPPAAASQGVLAKISLGALAGPAIGLSCAWLASRAAAARARSPKERAVLMRSIRGIVVFCLVMSAALVVVLMQAGKTYTAGGAVIVAGVFAWTAVLVLGIMLECHRTDRIIDRIRVETGTTDDIYVRRMEAAGKKVRRPSYIESSARFLGLPLFAAAFGGSDLKSAKLRKVCAWIAIGDVAFSPLMAMGGLAIAPISFGAISIGVVALSIFWGVGVGFIAVGSLACGWWAFGCAALGWEFAAGFAATAREHAIGVAASAAEANTAAAKAFLKSLPAEWAELFAGHAPAWIAGVLLLALACRRWTMRRSHNL